MTTPTTEYPQLYAINKEARANIALRSVGAKEPFSNLGHVLRGKYFSPSLRADKQRQRHIAEELRHPYITHRIYVMGVEEEDKVNIGVRKCWLFPLLYPYYLSNPFTVVYVDDKHVEELWPNKVAHVPYDRRLFLRRNRLPPILKNNSLFQSVFQKITSSGT